jgi:hypothetical protein
MERILIEKRIDELSIETFEFYQTDNKLYLDKYYVMRRDDINKRKYKIDRSKYYYRLMERDSTITEAQVPLTDEIKAQAIKQFVDTIKCLKWSERYL